MYTKEYYDEDNDMWNILDPDGDVIISNLTENQADILISHLNRGNT